MNEQQKDIIGEIMNISMGAGANALAILLMKPCIITTPQVDIIHHEDLTSEPDDDCMLVRIQYTKGVDGVNIFTLKKSDMSVIMGALMGMEMEIQEFDEMTSSAACEIMNQMMGASATALAEFFDEVVDISTPTSHVVKEREGLLQYFNIGEGDVIRIKFTLDIKDTLNTAFMVYLDESIANTLIEKATKKRG